MNKKTLKTTLYSLIVVFILIIVEMSLIGMETGIWRTFFIYAMFTLWILFFLLGIMLIILTFKSKIKGKLKLYLFLTGFSSIGFPVGTVAHNLFYGIGIALEHIIIIKYLMEVLHVAFFMISIFVCPIVFLIGIIGSIILFRKLEKENE